MEAAKKTQKQFVTDFFQFPAQIKSYKVKTAASTTGLKNKKVTEKSLLNPILTLSFAAGIKFFWGEGKCVVGKEKRNFRVE